eukprot:scaffold6258_cov82-Isochrysis_galbana.AAC.2
MSGGWWVGRTHPSLGPVRASNPPVQDGHLQLRHGLQLLPSKHEQRQRRNGRCANQTRRQRPTVSLRPANVEHLTENHPFTTCGGAMGGGRGHGRAVGRGEGRSAGRREGQVPAVGECWDAVGTVDRRIVNRGGDAAGCGQGGGTGERWGGGFSEGELGKAGRLGGRSGSGVAPRCDGAAPPRVAGASGPHARGAHRVEAPVQVAPHHLHLTKLGTRLVGAGRVGSRALGVRSRAPRLGSRAGRALPALGFGRVPPLPVREDSQPHVGRDGGGCGVGCGMRAGGCSDPILRIGGDRPRGGARPSPQRRGEDVPPRCAEHRREIDREIAGSQQAAEQQHAARGGIQWQRGQAPAQLAQARGGGARRAGQRHRKQAGGGADTPRYAPPPLLRAPPPSGMLPCSGMAPPPSGMFPCSAMAPMQTSRRTASATAAKGGGVGAPASTLARGRRGAAAAACSASASRLVVWISGMAVAALPLATSSEYKRTTSPGALRPSRPARWAAASAGVSSVRRRVAREFESHSRRRDRPVSTTKDTSGIVSDVSAMELSRCTTEAASRHSAWSSEAPWADAASRALSSAAEASRAFTSLARCRRMASKGRVTSRIGFGLLLFRLATLEDDRWPGVAPPAGWPEAPPGKAPSKNRSGRSRSSRNSSRTGKRWLSFLGSSRRASGGRLK